MIRECDVLVIGGGGAGLSAALAAAGDGARVIVASKTYPVRSQTAMAQGGINAALDGDVATHIADTLRGGAGLGDDAAVGLMCERGPAALGRLDTWGVLFDRDEAGALRQRPFGGGTVRRTCYSSDRTGQKIMHTLYDRALMTPGIEWLYERSLINIDTEGKRARGATFLNIAEGEIDYVKAGAVIVATGGYAGVYYGVSTNSSATAGEGIAAAARAGAKLRDMEFVQFHPTTLASSSILVSEAARGEGARLVNDAGERFVDELATRDVVARAIGAQIAQGRQVYLDMRHLGEGVIDDKLPQERRLCRLYEGVDPVSGLVPIRPSAHYTMGGIAVDVHGQSSVRGLFACGEAACSGVHGANRLGGNSLLEIVVFGDEAGHGAAAYAAGHDTAGYDPVAVWKKDTAFVVQAMNLPCRIDFYPKQAQMGKIMDVNVGLVREERYLKAVMGFLRQAQDEYPFMGVKDKSRRFNTNLVEFLEFGSRLQLAEMIVVAGLNRCESRGSHFRSDFPDRDDTVFGQHSITWLVDGVVHMEFEETLKRLR